MSDALILALDAGTSVMKAVAFDLEGRILASEGRANRYETRPDGAVEQDMAATWRDAAAVKPATPTTIATSDKTYALIINPSGAAKMSRADRTRPIQDNSSISSKLWKGIY